MLDISIVTLVYKPTNITGSPPCNRSICSGFPLWWEATASPAEKSSDPVLHHAHTRIAGQVGLLVDPGAHENLIGSETCELTTTKRLTVGPVCSMVQPVCSMV